jgi:hypothetical protein
VEVRLDDVSDAQAIGLGSPEIDVDVASRIDDRSDPLGLIDDERREMAEPVDPILGDPHAASLYRGGPC